MRLRSTGNQNPPEINIAPVWQAFFQRISKKKIKSAEKFLDLQGKSFFTGIFSIL